MYEKYKQLYEAINKADRIRQPIGGISGGSFGSVSSVLRTIRDEFVELRNCYDRWMYAIDEAESDEFSVKYTGILSNISVRTVGGTTKLNWQGGYRDYDGTWISGGGWRSSGNVQGLNRTIENAKTQAENFKPNFDAVVTIAREIDEKREELIKAVDELERRVNNGECNDELRKALTERHGNPPMSLIEQYRQVLKWDNLQGLATSYKNAGYDYIDNAVKPMLDGVMYRNSSNASAGSLTREDLAGLPSDHRFTISSNTASGMVIRFASFPADSVTYSMPPGFLLFSDVSGRHFEFYEELKAMMEHPVIEPVKMFDGQEDEGGSDAKEKQENMINALLKLVNTAYEGITNQPLGASYITNNALTLPDVLNIPEIVGLLAQALGSNVIGVIQDPTGSMMSAWEYMLLLTYCTSVFSNYTTTRPDSIGKRRDGMGIPL
jgi:hypothetical protein